MRLVYVVISASLPGTAVTEKVINQVKSFQRCGQEAVGLLFSHEVKEEKVIDNNIRFIPLPSVTSKYFSNVYSEMSDHRNAFLYLNTFLKNDDLIFLRYTSSNKELYKFIKRRKNKVLLEFQSKDNETLILNKSKYELRLRGLFSTFLTNTAYYYLPLFNDMRFGLSIRRNALALVGVTKEICEYQISRYGLENKTMLLTNSVETKRFPVRQHSQGQKYTLLFLRGANTAAEYHGVDRLIRGMAHDPALKKSVKVICAGRNFGNEKSLVEDLNLGEAFEFIEYVEKDSLGPLFDSADAGIGTLALHRIKLKEGTVLKVREYYARGLPFIYAYHDTDIDANNELAKYCLRFPADESDIDMNKVISFMDEMRRNKNVSQAMHELAEEYLSFDSKSIVFLRKLKKLTI